MTHQPHPYASVARIRRLAANSPSTHSSGASPALLAARHVTERRTARLDLPAGAACRVVDDKGRLKLNADRPVSELVGWEPGALSVTFDGPWGLLTQISAMVGRPRQRNSALAQLVRLPNGIERVCLAPAHLSRLGLGEDRTLLVAPYPAAGGLLLVTPAVALAGAPARLLELTTPRLTVLAPRRTAGPVDPTPTDTEEARS